MDMSRLSLSNEGLEIERSGSGTKEKSRPALSSAMRWLVSETDLMRSRLESGLSS